MYRKPGIQQDFTLSLKMLIRTLSSAGQPLSLESNLKRSLISEPFGSLQELLPLPLIT